jgi:hypothetical protein
VLQVLCYQNDEVSDPGTPTAKGKESKDKKDGKDAKKSDKKDDKGKVRHANDCCCFIVWVF